MIVKETNNEAKTDAMTLMGNDLMNSPEASGRKINGRKAIIKVAVQPNTAVPIWEVAFRTASFRLYPFNIHLSIFSITTILSSTNNPRATTSPTILS